MNSNKSVYIWVHVHRPHIKRLRRMQSTNFQVIIDLRTNDIVQYKLKVRNIYKRALRPKGKPRTLPHNIIFTH